MVIKTKKSFKKSFILLPLILFLAIYNSIPEKITIFEGQKGAMLFGISAKADNYKIGKYDFSIFPHLKTVSVSVLPAAYVIPSGEAIGVKLYTDGVMVIGSGSVTDSSGKTYEPAKNAGVIAGDRIVAVNGSPVSDIDGLKRLVNAENGHTELSIIRGENSLILPVNAVYSEDTNSYLLGLWVRDSAAGIGTMTFYNPENSTFAAVGHGICDYDTNLLMKSHSGSINFCRIKSVKKSENGEIGEILGEFSAKNEGNILLNSETGIYGNTASIPDINPVPVASRFELETGYAELLCDVDGLGPRAYKIEITRISTSAKQSGKSFVFKVTDSALLEKTGGIVQGMSGSPILQNGKLVGAVTHVFVNDASKGYGIFAENMLDTTCMIR
ncbi:MAG: SpoIVB peptidase [Clostridia bacterium]|nr:SpoIVB peptidase [Clostridia bacterium]